MTTPDERDPGGHPSGAGPTRRVIYDFGANNGDDIPYYLKKADVVVAVEANPTLCRDMEQRFAAEIQERRLFIENCVVAPEGCEPEVPFYLHKRHHVLGQFPQPDASVAADYTTITLPSKPIAQIMRKYGDPYYIKIDMEGFDDVLLDELFRNSVRPPYISAESHNVRVFALLVAMGGYSAFKLVDGATVEKNYKNHPIQVQDRQELYSFPRHSAGPFGDDIPGEWMNAEDLFYALADAKLGWKDIHATSLVSVDPVSRRRKRRHALRHLRSSLPWRGRS